MSGFSVDFNNELPTPSSTITSQKSSWHEQKARMGLAYWVLFGIFFMFIIAIMANALARFEILDFTVSHLLFDLCRTGLLPIVTLILGYYFSKSE